MKKLLWIFIIAALAAGGYYAYSQYQERQRALAASNYQTLPAERGSLTATVGATGIVRANQTAVLAWQASGIVEQIQVQVGNLVDADQILAVLQRTSLSQNIILAQADLVNAQKALEELDDTELALAQAEQVLAQARDTLKKSETRVSNIGAPARDVDIDSAQASVLLAKIQLDKARKNYQPYENKPENNVLRATYFNRLAEAQQRYDSAVRRLNNMQGTVSEITVGVAEADFGLAQANLNEAQRQVDRLKAGADPKDVAVIEARIEAAQATINLARIAAPFRGTITDITIKPGDQVAPGALAFRLDDLSHLLVDVQISEVDINRIQPGQDVSLTFDAILGREYNGRVIEVAPVGTANQGVVDFTVTLELVDADQAVKPGMTAAVNIVVNQLDDVLLVPNRAVRIKEGQRVVYVLRDGKAEPVSIVLGSSADTVSEVIGGELRAGDQIVLNPPIEFEQGGPPPFMR